MEHALILKQVGDKFVLQESKCLSLHKIGRQKWLKNLIST